MSTSSSTAASVGIKNIPLSFSKNALIANGADGRRENGSVVRSTRYASTDFIDMTLFVALRYELAACPFCYSVCFFDEEKRFISGKATESFLVFPILVGHSPVPEGAKYARFLSFSDSDESLFPPGAPLVEGFLTQDDYTHYKSHVLKHDGLKIVCLGDSLTEGHQGGYVQARSYPYFLSKFLGCETVNYGRSGYTASQYYDLYKQKTIKVSDADIVLIMLGSNLGLSYYGTQHLEAYKGLVSEVKKDVKPGCKVVLLTPTPGTKNPDRPTYEWHHTIENAVEETRKLAKSEGTYLIDVFAEGPIQNDKEDVYQPVDGVHLSAAGYEALARFVAESLESIIKENK